MIVESGNKVKKIFEIADYSIETLSILDEGLKKYPDDMDLIQLRNEAAGPGLIDEEKSKHFRKRVINQIILTEGLA